MNSSFSNGSYDKDANITRSIRTEEQVKNDYIVASLFLSTSFFGLITYIPCLVAMYKSKHLKSPCYTFMVSLGVSDCASLIGWFVIGLDTCTHGDIIPKKMITVVLCFLVIGWGSLTTHEVMISINRYIAVCHSSRHDLLFNRNRMVVLLSVSWFYAICIHASPTFIPPNMYYSLNGYYAVWASDAITTYYTYEDISCCSLVFLICIFSYISVIVKYAHVRRQVSPNGKKNNKSRAKEKKDAMFQFRLALQTSVRCLTFFIYDLLYYLVSFYSTNLWAVFICSTYLWCLNNALNPWVYLIFNEQLRKVLKNKIRGRHTEPAAYEPTTLPRMGRRGTIGLVDITKVDN